MLITGSFASLCINAFISSELEQGHNSHNIRPHSNHNMTGRKQLKKLLRNFLTPTHLHSNMRRFKNCFPLIRSWNTQPELNFKNWIRPTCSYTLKFSSEIYVTWFSYNSLRKKWYLKWHKLCAANFSAYKCLCFIFHTSNINCSATFTTQLSRLFRATVCNFKKTL